MPAGKEDDWEAEQDRQLKWPDQITIKYISWHVWKECEWEAEQNRAVEMSTH